MTVQELNVYIAARRAGTLVQDDYGAHSFSYYPTYDGPPLSLSMPLANRTYHTRVVDAYLLGLLPDDERVRREAGRRFDVSGNNPFALLSHMGLDCPGAIQICRPEDAHLVHEEGELTPLSNEQIAERLSPASGREEDTWLRADERWSLGGNQSKFALRLEGGRWFECHGSAASTHIFKPGIVGMNLQALDEFVTMRLASICGISSEQVDYLEFCGVPAVVATRYDRRRTTVGIERIHQEDLCQALSVTPDKKYAEDGGPSTPQVLDLLRGISNDSTSVMSFSAMLFFNYLMAAPDAHAKNYSILHVDKGRCILAPMYDVASGLPYDLSGNRPLRMAMSIGGENRHGYLKRTHINRYADQAGLPKDAAATLMANLCDRVLKNAPDVFEETIQKGVAGAAELAERMIPRLEISCRRMPQEL